MEDKEQVADSGAIVAQIATELGETEEKPVREIEQIVTHCGPEESLAWLAQTRSVEDAGGLLTKDRSRRRTRGGVYFFLVRQHLVEKRQWQAVEAIFGPPWSPESVDSYESTLPEATWAERGKLQTEIGDEYGKATNVKVTLIGKPGKTVERKNFTLLMMTHKGPLPALPKGMPAPEKFPATSYVVYVGIKQWRKVREALRNPEDVLIIEGSQFWDAEYESIAVFATNVNTRLLQQRQREQQVKLAEQAKAAEQAEAEE